MADSDGALGPQGRTVCDRRAARVLLLDGQGRVLLMRGFDPAAPETKYWFTVGGGIDEGETPQQAAVRELHEETGLRVTIEDVEGPIWNENSEFGFAQWWVRQRQEFYVVRVPRWDPVPTAWEQEEITAVDALAWWTLPQLRAQAAAEVHDGPGNSGELVYPESIVALLEGLLP